MKKLLSGLAGTAAIAVTLLANPFMANPFMASAVAGNLISERGKIALNAPSTDIGKIKPKRIFARPTRSWASAPPTIPHSSKGYKISIKYNICMSCHVSNYKRMKAPKTPVSHYITYNGTLDHSKMDRRRYFCTQCHVPQADIKSLVKNSYKASYTPPSDPKHIALIAKGKKLAKSIECSECHETGKTVEGIRFLEGWESKAMVHVLKAYKRGDIKDKDMSDVAEDLEEDQMKALGAYFASLSAIDKK